MNESKSDIMYLQRIGLYPKLCENMQKMLFIGSETSATPIENCTTENYLSRDELF